MICLKKVPSGKFNIAMKHGHFSSCFGSVNDHIPRQVERGWLWSWFSPKWPSIQLPSGYLTFRHGEWPIYWWFRWFTYKKWWFSMAMLNNETHLLGAVFVVFPVFWQSGALSLAICCVLDRKHAICWVMGLKSLMRVAPQCFHGFHWFCHGVHVFLMLLAELYRVFIHVSTMFMDFLTWFVNF